MGRKTVGLVFSCVIVVSHHRQAYGIRYRFMVFGSYEGELVAQALLYLCILENPTAKIAELVEELLLAGLDGTNRRWVERAILSWDWNWIFSARIARRKYADANLQEYLQYGLRIRDYRLDRVSFNLRDLFKSYCILNRISFALGGGD